MRATMVFQRGFFWVAACVLPACVRVEWLATWNAEIWHVHRDGASWMDSWRFALGSVADVLAIRCELPEESSYLISSPAACLLTMVLINAALVLLGLLTSSFCRSLWSEPVWDAIRSKTVTPLLDALYVQLLFVAASFLIVIPVTAVFGTRAFSGYDHFWKKPCSRASLFYLAKLLLIVSIFESVLTGTMLYPGLQLNGAVLAYVLMLRWAIRDQQQRCPVCLKRLGSPVHFGRPSCALLDWNLQEYVCDDGHGVMQIPAVSFSGQSAQAWLPLI
ncbi:hypothetical protein [Granulicella sp. S156]|uniref:hypothetical protein n=1 Tax=Granulicella sp. S156 TaxID=1747224 RepID=UPI00131EB569|nr:hypothetical protein [Granulicella sp. S156]